MFKADAKWTQQLQFEGHGNSGHAFLMDGDGKAASTPMELVLAALCGCTAYDLVNILQKKREPFASRKRGGRRQDIHRSFHVALGQRRRVGRVVIGRGRRAVDDVVQRHAGLEQVADEQRDGAGRPAAVWL